MNMLPHAPLPLATTSAFTGSRAHQPAPGEKWQQALQRVTGTWHAGGAVPEREANRQGTPGRAMEGASPPKVLVAASADRLISQHCAGPVALGAPGSSRAAAYAGIGGSPTAVVHTAPSPSGPPPDGSSFRDVAEQGEPALHPRARKAQDGSGERSSLRMHLEHDAQGLCVWLGLDGDAAAVRLRAASMLAELQRVLAGPGYRLVRVVCNGTAIYAAPPLEKETS